MFAVFDFGAIAQLGERNTGSVEVGGSIPPGSTKHKTLTLARGGFLFVLIPRSRTAEGVRWPTGPWSPAKGRTHESSQPRLSQIALFSLNRLGVLLNRYGLPSLVSSQCCFCWIHTISKREKCCRNCRHVSFKHCDENYVGICLMTVVEEYPCSAF